MKKLTLRAVVSEGAGMRYNKTIMLSNGVECCLRNGTESDGQLVLDNFNLTHSETDYLLTYPDENSFNAEQESQFLKEKAESEREIELIAIVDGVITGTAGIEAIGTKYKVRHRAEFGISVAKKYWGLGIGKALLASCIECVLGERCNIGQNVVISPDVVLGNNVKVQNNVSVYTGVTCEDDVFLGPSCVFTNVTNPRSAVNRKSEYAKTHVGKGATIGANATIVCGHDIGEYAFIGAGAVVTKTVPAYALLVGNPARQMGWMSEYGHRLDFDEDGVAVCPESKERYRLKEGKVAKL